MLKAVCPICYELHDMGYIHVHIVEAHGIEDPYWHMMVSLKEVPDGYSPSGATLDLPEV